MAGLVATPSAMGGTVQESTVAMYRILVSMSIEKGLDSAGTQQPQHESHTPHTHRMVIIV